MVVKINCKSNDQVFWCKDKRIKRSLWGLGSRCCLVAEGKPCQYQEQYPRPVYKVERT